MKSFVIAVAVTTGLFLSTGTANAQFFGGRGGAGGGYNSFLGSGYSYPGYGNSYPGRSYSPYGSPGYGYSNPGYQYSGSNYGYSYPSYQYSGSNYSYSNPSYQYSSSSYGSPYSSYTASSDPCCCTDGTNNYRGITSGGSTPTGTGTIVASGYTPVDMTGSTSYYSPSVEGATTAYPVMYSDSYSYPVYSSGRSTRGLLGGWRR